jgi:hypothetical protein
MTVSATNNSSSEKPWSIVEDLRMRGLAIVFSHFENVCIICFIIGGAEF